VGTAWAGTAELERYFDTNEYEERSDMQYQCTFVPEGGIDRLPGTIASAANEQLADMARHGWQLVSTSTMGGSAVIFLFWEKA
jgi:hypothetical protein